MLHNSHNVFITCKRATKKTHTHWDLPVMLVILPIMLCCTAKNPPIMFTLMLKTYLLYSIILDV